MWRKKTRECEMLESKLETLAAYVKAYSNGGAHGRFLQTEYNLSIGPPSSQDGSSHNPVEVAVGDDSRDI